jgi:hypothetical protein
VERGNAEGYGFHEAHHPVVRHCDEWVGSRYQHASVLPVISAVIVSTINRATAQFIGSTTLGLALANLGVSSSRTNASGEIRLLILPPTNGMVR